MLQLVIDILLYRLGHKEVSHLIWGDRHGQAGQNKVWVVRQTVSQKLNKAIKHMFENQSTGYRRCRKRNRLRGGS